MNVLEKLNQIDNQLEDLEAKIKLYKEDRKLVFKWLKTIYQQTVIDFVDKGLGTTIKPLYTITIPDESCIYCKDDINYMIRVRTEDFSVYGYDIIISEDNKPMCHLPDDTVVDARECDEFGPVIKQFITAWHKAIMESSAYIFIKEKI